MHSTRVVETLAVMLDLLLVLCYAPLLPPQLLSWLGSTPRWPGAQGRRDS